MRSESQPMLPFGVHPHERVRADFPFGAADARREAQPTREKKQKLYEEILSYARARENFTADELARDWNCSPNHTAPRISEMLDKGLLVETGERRKTRSDGWAAVLAAKGAEA